MRKRRKICSDLYIYIATDTKIFVFHLNTATQQEEQNLSIWSEHPLVHC